MRGRGSFSFLFFVGVLLAASLCGWPSKARAELSHSCRGLLLQIREKTEYDDIVIRSLLASRVLKIMDADRVTEGEEKYLTGVSGRTLVALEGEQIVASITFAIEGEHSLDGHLPKNLLSAFVPKFAKVAVFSRLVAAGYATRGIGFALIFRAFELCKAAGVHYIVFTGASEMRRYYKKLNLIPVVADLLLPALRRRADLYVVNLAEAYKNCNRRLFRFTVGSEQPNQQQD